MGENTVVLTMFQIAISPSFKAHDDVINQAAMKYQNNDEPQNSKENVSD